MKIKVKDLKPNPYRNMGKYPVDREKIEALKISIGETDFWDNLLTRQQNGEYQIAYGHHRLIALQELGIKEVNLPVRKLDNATMIRIMANENMDHWKSNPAVTLETVRAARDFLDAELAKYDTWEEYKKVYPLLSKGITKEANYQSLRSRGVGGETILKFLGGTWKEWMIQGALQTLNLIKEDKIDEEAVESLPTMRHVREFIKPAQELSKPKQRKLAKEIVEEETPSREIPKKAIETKWKPEKKDNQKEIEWKKKQKTFDDFLLETEQSILELSRRMKDIARIKDELGDNIIVDKSLSIGLTASMEVLHSQLTNLLKID